MNTLSTPLIKESEHAQNVIAALLTIVPGATRCQVVMHSGQSSIFSLSQPGRCRSCGEALVQSVGRI